MLPIASLTWIALNNIFKKILILATITDRSQTLAFKKEFAIATGCNKITIIKNFSLTIGDRLFIMRQ